MVIEIYEEMQMGEELIKRILNYFALKDTIKEMEEEIRLIEDNIINILGRGKTGKVGGFAIRLEDKTLQKVDSEILQSKYPEIYKKVCKKEVVRALEIEEGYYGHI